MICCSVRRKTHFEQDNPGEDLQSGDPDYSDQHQRHHDRLVGQQNTTWLSSPGSGTLVPGAAAVAVMPQETTRRIYCLPVFKRDSCIQQSSQRSGPNRAN